MLTAHNLDRVSLDYVRTNIRPHDLRELDLQGYDDAAYESHLADRYSYALKTPEGEPVCVGFARPVLRRLRIGGFGTAAVAKHWPSIHRLTRSFLDFAEAQEPELTISCEVWRGHAESRRWLRRLGFVETGLEVRRRGEPFLLLERP